MHLCRDARIVELTADVTLLMVLSYEIGFLEDAVRKPRFTRDQSDRTSFPCFMSRKYGVLREGMRFKLEDSAMIFHVIYTYGLTSTSLRACYGERRLTYK